jgi:plasmid stabilization system protein ParE
MTTLSLSRRALNDLERFVDFELERGADAGPALSLITQAVEVLRRHPFIGRPVSHGLRELVISRGVSGYVALYEFLEARDEVIVHALRQQREAGYAED